MVEIKKQFKRYDTIGEVNNGISETVPNQALTVRQILERYASGTIMPISFEREFSEDLPDLRFMDISELEIMAETNAAVINEHKLKEDKIKMAKIEADKLELEQFRKQKKDDENSR